MKTKLMIVDDNEEFLGECVAYFSAKEDREVVATATNGEEALEKIAAAAPDVLLLDIVMPRLDGYGVLERLPSTQRTIVMGARYYMMKPFRFEQLDARITETMRESGVRVRNKSLEEKITNIFITVGIPAHIKGYQFLREAIKMAIDNPDVINSITKRLYPEVARRFDTSPSKVERAIRHAIEVAWNRGKIENINSLFGVRVYNHNEKPTNGEFIALVADKMLLESV